MNVLLCSVGRRPYLVEWFKDAQVSTGSNGKVIAADADVYAPSQVFADSFELAPMASDPAYATWLSEIIERHDIGLAISVNDFELSQWALLPDDLAYEPLLRLTPQLQRIAEDKIEMHDSLTAAGVKVPDTWLLRTVLENPSVLAERTDLVLKGRFGSASRGLRLTTPEDLEAHARETYTEVTHPDGGAAKSFEEAFDLFVVQPRIVGQEYGVDVVNNFEGSFAGVLARKKIKMRFGETDQAVSVEPEPFRTAGSLISTVTSHRGLIDTDIIVDEDGEVWLIDLNPRFGGGYPFSHIAGADVPTTYLMWRQDAAVRHQHLDYRNGVASAKAVAAVEVYYE